MDKDKKRAERRQDSDTIWQRRLNREYNNSKKYFNRGDKHTFENLQEAEIASDLKNSTYGMLLKNTANPMNHKNVGKQLDNKHFQHLEREEGKKISLDAIIEYNNKDVERIDKAAKMFELREELRNVIDNIEIAEELLRDLPERLQGLLQRKIEIETEICYLQR